ncbi:plasmid pRiA4b ORF-3 family protein [Kineococcus sp. TBRC 1896]|uniref:Plasmid pRiA4b ORF-3 family protein n=1 Tax=Kineococcus mangrovi TaxID=1660183 RepID=A0ABV4I7F2_9ACTN
MPRRPDAPAPGSFGPSVLHASFDRARPDPAVAEPREETVTFRLRVSLDDVDPPVWRRLDVASDLTLDDVHDALQLAMGWTNSHLHGFRRFDAGSGEFDTPFLTSFEVAEGEDGVDEATVRLDQVLFAPGDRLEYAYDFGDGWGHTVLLEAELPHPEVAPGVVCTDGARACPPEDCGGPWGYQQVLDLARDRQEGRPVPVDLQHLLDAYPDLDPEHFSVEETNEAIAAGPVLPEPGGGHGLDTTGFPAELADVVRRLPAGTAHTLHDLVRRALPHGNLTAAPSSADQDGLLHDVLWVLDRVGDEGLPLTSAGYLKPVDVRAAFEAFDLDAEWIGAGNREVQTLPVLEFRGLLRSFGLVRTYRGRLLLTKLGRQLRGDQARLLAHLAAGLPVGKQEHERLPQLLVLLAVAAGRSPEAHEAWTFAAAVLDDLGWRLPERRLVWHDAIGPAAPTTTLLRRLGLPPVLGLREDPPPPGPALVAFARTALTTR